MKSADSIKVAIVLLVAASLWVAFDNATLRRAPADSTLLVRDECSGPIIWTMPNGMAVSLLGEQRFELSVSLRTCLPGPGILRLSLRGSAVAAVGSQVVIALGTTNLWEGFVTDPIELELDIPHAGTMLIAFVNDRYEPPEDRNLWISDVVFTPH